MKKINIIIIVALLLSGCIGSGLVKKEATPIHYEHDFVLLHWNDFHSYNIPWVPVNANKEKLEMGGSAYLDAVMDSVEALFPNALRINAGDDFQGTPVSSIFKGKSQIDLLNAMEVDVFTIGNHEFDYGWENVYELQKEANFKMGAANLFIEADMTNPLQKYSIYEFNEKKIAFINLTHNGLESLTVKENIEGLFIEDPAITAQRIIDELKAEGLGLFVAVTHIGINGDMRLAEKVPELDLIIGGHSHSYLPEARIVGNTKIVQTGSYGRNLGIIKLTSENGDIVNFDYHLEEIQKRRVKPSPDVLAIVKKYEDLVGAEMDVKIGVLKVDWISRGLVSNIGSWQCDVMNTATGADISFQNNGGIRKNLSAGDIKVRDIWEIAPFGNTCVVFEQTGTELLTMLNYMVKENKFRGMQTAGLTLVVNQADTTIKSILVQGKIIDPGKTYKIATNNYIAGHGDRNFGIVNLEYTDTMLIDRDIFINAIKEQKIIVTDIKNRVSYE